jgi:5'-nucleotidase / UDP-sugar diphosphatase
MSAARIRGSAVAWLLAALIILAGCQMAPLAVTPAPDATLIPTLRDGAATALPAAQNIQSSSPRHLTILYTNDEHGWIAAQTQKGGGTTGGAAEMLGRWKATEGYQPGGAYLVLSGGDMWTGPAISTWFNGDSTAEVMNLMGYQAAAIGNHDFDFGVDVLRRHAAASRFPFLSANLVRKGTTEPPDFVKPFAIIEAGGLKVGVIGLTTVDTPHVTNPRNVADFSFLPYTDALTRYVPQARAAGAQLLIVLAHVCAGSLRDLAPTAKVLGVSVLAGAHCHERITEQVDGLSLIESGSYMQAYVRLALDVDPATGTVSNVQATLVDNHTGQDKISPDAAVGAAVAIWQGKADAALGEVIGYTKTGLGAQSPALFNLVTDAWLAAYPNAQVAITNRGGFRQALPSGPITLGDIVGVLPFNNTLVDAAVTGAQLTENLDCCGGAVGGLRPQGNGWTLADGTPLDPTKTYHVLINDFMAAGGDNYRFDKQDPHAYYTAIDWRQPVIDYIRQLASTQAKPLETLIDTQDRTGR